MKFFPWFKAAPAPSFEKELSEISKKVLEREQRQINHTIQYKHVSSKFTLYSITIYLVFIAYAVVARCTDFYTVTAVVALPALIYLVRKAISLWFNKLISNNAEYIESLKAQQKQKIEDLKERTNFYKTKALLDRFDNENQQHELELEQQAQRELQELHEAQQAQELQRQLQTQFQQQQQPFYPQQNQLQFQPTWFDRLLDKIIVSGDDNNNRYALICPNCKSHNGLAGPGELPEQVIYICPHCGYKNGSFITENESNTAVSSSLENSTTVVERQKPLVGPGVEKQTAATAEPHPVKKEEEI
ncbi:hypothetical protein D0Z03_000359 [Geotrichum reessii]|nr:hypothetical protein D0Z03_000359 [Galactomyces reessii]